MNASRPYSRRASHAVAAGRTTPRRPADRDGLAVPEFVEVFARQRPLFAALVAPERAASGCSCGGFKFPGRRDDKVWRRAARSTPDLLMVVLARLALCLLFAGAATGGTAHAQEGRGETPGGRGGSEGAGGQTGGAEELPAPLGSVFDFLDPGRYHRRFDQILGLETDRSDKPRAPELPLAVFVETVRPLGALKYENQLNYFVSAFTGDAPTFQSLTYEYVFADWNAARFELIAPRPGRIDALGLGYQRTLGVGADHNRAHGFLILPELSLKGTGFVGGSAFYTLAWKPEEKSPWTVGGSAGANRASFSNRPLGGAAGGVGSMMERMPGMAAPVAEADEVRV